MKNKTAIIMSGGGMTCSYGVGSLLALVKKYKLKNPAIVIAGSGSAGTLAYFVAQQYDVILNIWSNLLSTKEFIDPLRISKVVDIDYLIDEVFKKQATLNEKKIRASKILHLIPATNVETGKVTYFSTKNGIDVFEAMRASKAMPVLFNKKVCIRGKQYCDSYISTSTKLNALKAIKLGATKVIIIDNTTPHLINRFLFFAWFNLRNKNFKKNYLKNLEKINETNFPSNVQMIYLKPEKKLKISMLDNSRRALGELTSTGYTKPVPKRVAF